MCGKFTQMLSWGALVELAQMIDAPRGPAEGVTPMRYATVIRRGADGRRETARMRWGLVPPWAKDPAGPRHIHARAEDIEAKPTFRDAFLARRGLVVVSTFNEGEEIARTRKRQHTVTPNDGKPLAIAVLWERWGKPHADALLTFAMVTVPANRLIGRIADRMPAIIQPTDWAKWLGEAPADMDELKAMLVPFEGDWRMHPEGPRPAKPQKPDDGQASLF